MSLLEDTRTCEVTDLVARLPSQVAVTPDALREAFAQEFGLDAPLTTEDLRLALEQEQVTVYIDWLQYSEYPHVNFDAVIGSPAPLTFTTLASHINNARAKPPLPCRRKKRKPLP